MFVRTNADKYDIDELYEFADHTGILERHRQLLAKPFHENQVQLNCKILTILTIVRLAID